MNTENQTSRIKYGFTLNFPAKPFTIKNLMATGHHPQYITAYMRIKKALANGEIVVAGEKAPKNKRRGRREVIYNRVNATTSVVSASTAATV